MFLLIIYFASIMTSIIGLISINSFILTKRNSEESKIYFVSVILLDAYITFWLILQFCIIALFLYKHEEIYVFYNPIILVITLYILKALNIIFCYMQSKKIKTLSQNKILKSKLQISLFLFSFIIPFINIIWIFKILFLILSNEKSKEVDNKIAE